MTLDLRKPVTVEQLIADCQDKLDHESDSSSNDVIEILINTEVMLDMAHRLLRLEGEA